MGYLSIDNYRDMVAYSLSPAFAPILINTVRYMEKWWAHDTPKFDHVVDLLKSQLKRPDPESMEQAIEQYVNEHDGMIPQPTDTKILLDKKKSD